MTRSQRNLMGAYIRQQREVADMSMRQVSAMVGISNPYLSQIERGLRAPSEAVATGIATALGISIDELYEQEGARTESTALLEAIKEATELTEGQRASLAEIYRSFVSANGGAAGDYAPRGADTTGTAAPDDE